jgi:hypothetical protein
MPRLKECPLALLRGTKKPRLIKAVFISVAILHLFYRIASSQKTAPRNDNERQLGGIHADLGKGPYNVQ